MSTGHAFWKIAEERASRLERELAAAQARIAELTEDLAMRVEQVRNAVRDRDRYKDQADQKRRLAREFEAELGFSEEEARADGAIAEAVRRIRELKANQCVGEPAAWYLHNPHGLSAFHTREDVGGIPLYRKAK